MRQQKNMFQIKEQDKKAQKNKWSRDTQSTQEGVQGSDHKDDQRTWEMNGCTEQELRSFFFFFTKN